MANPSRSQCWWAFSAFVSRVCREIDTYGAILAGGRRMVPSPLIACRSLVLSASDLGSAAVLHQEAI